MKTKPYPFQLEDFNHSKDKKSFALLLRMGLGKSKIAIDTACHLYDRGEIDSVVVTVRSSALSNWYQKEVDVHSWQEENRKYIWRGLKSTRQIDLLKEFSSRDGLKWYFINIEAFSSKSKSNCYRLQKLFENINPDKALAIVDEATSIKDPTSNRFKLLMTHMGAYRYKRILTGTILKERPEDAYAPFLFLDKLFWSSKGFKNYHAFKNYFCVYRQRRIKTHTFKERIGYRNLDKLSRWILDPNISSYRWEIDLPEMVTKVEDIELTAEQAKHYKEVQKNMRTVIDSYTVSVPNKLQAITKCQQITCGVLHTQEGQVLIPCANPKVERTLDLIEQNLPNKTVVFSLLPSKILVNYMYERACKKFGRESVVLFTGDTPKESRGDIIAAFQDPTSLVKVFIGNTAADRGITLTAANLQIFLSESYSVEVTDQANKRLHRIGQDKNVVQVHLVARGTADEAILRAQREKKNIIDVVMNHEKNKNQPR